eukprot:9488347-Pyramimonas_sp.AAC.1
MFYSSSPDLILVLVSFHLFVGGKTYGHQRTPSVDASCVSLHLPAPFFAGLPHPRPDTAAGVPADK